MQVAPSVLALVGSLCMTMGPGPRMVSGRGADNRIHEKMVSQLSVFAQGAY